MTVCPRCGAQVSGARGVCESCGAPLPTSPAGGSKVSWAFAAIGLAAVVIVAAVFLLGSQAPSGPPAPVQPAVALSGYQLQSTSSAVQVVSASAAVAPKYYQVGLMANGSTMMGPSPMPSMGGGSVQFTMGTGMSGMMFTVQWMDRGAMGSLDSGDSFYVNRSYSMMGCIPMSMDFRLLWWNGSMVAHAPYAWTCTTLTKPVVTFSSVTVTATSASFSVAGATPVVAINNFKFNLQVNGIAAASAVVLASGNQTITVGNTTFYLQYSDISGNGNLKAGDALRIAKVGGDLPTGSYSFYLLWALDGSTIAVVNWTV